MRRKNILGIEPRTQSRELVLEQIEKYIGTDARMLHIVSLNPEIFVLTGENPEFKEVVSKAQIHIVDGIGTVAASRWLGVPLEGRISGVDLMGDIIKLADSMRLRVGLIGGQGNLANDLADCYGRSYQKAKFLGINGYNDVSHPTSQEEEKLVSIVTDYMPQIIFVAFGSPMQELWIERHSKLLKNCVCMGVGGGFDFLSGKVPRAPKIVRTLGLEWLFRLFLQPWRWRRQLRLFKFIFLVLKQKFSRN